MPPHLRTRRARAAVALAVVPAFASVGCTAEHEADLHRPAATVAPEDARDSAATDLVGRIERALRAPAASRTIPSAGAAARAQLDTATSNARALGLRQVGLRYLAPSSTALSEGEVERYGDAAWTADVQVSWRQPGVDHRPSLLTVPMVLTGNGKSQQFVAFSAADADHVPLWLLTRLAVVRTARSVAVAPTPAAARRLSAMAERAVTTVRRTLPTWRDRLLVQEAPSQRVFRSLPDCPSSRLEPLRRSPPRRTGRGTPERRGSSTSTRASTTRSAGRAGRS